LRLALWLTGDELPEDLRAIVTLLVDVTPANLEAYRALLEGYDRRVVSLETVINQTPVENLDTDVEVKKVVAERKMEASGELPTPSPNNAGNPTSLTGAPVEGEDPELEDEVPV
jgi:hypothetical protein